MSIRSKRKELRSAIAARLEQLRDLRKGQDLEETALTEAIKALAEMPRLSEPGEYLIEYSPVVPAFIEKGHCSICGEATIGYTDKWTGCPVCLNPFSVKHETLDGQNARTSIEAARRALAGQEKGELINA